MEVCAENNASENQISYIRYLVEQLTIMSEDILILANQFEGDASNYKKFLDDSINFSNGALICKKYVFGCIDLNSFIEEMLHEGLKDFVVQVPHIPSVLAEKHSLYNFGDNNTINEEEEEEEELPQQS